MTPDYLQELAEIMARLRAADGCPWDRAQTHATLKQFLVEECAEFLDAVDEGDDAGMCEELGDLLLQVAFHCQIARERGAFGLPDAARSICEKLRRRHPHVFGGATVKSTAEVHANWDRIKREEKKHDPERQSAIGGVPRHLPALHRAHKTLKKAAKTGFEWESLEAALAKVEEELGEVRKALAARDDAALREELGDLLFSTAALSAQRGWVAEELLGEALRKFERRFRHLEHLAAATGRNLGDHTPAELRALWGKAKHATAAGQP
ncbi:MAG: nucleoside triphosphate pyrophosphohydrolase [Lentisphaeria bacterium]|jgi:tetrapyrrole methylase family protein/MazG family protein